MTPEQLIARIKTTPTSIEFNEVISVLEANYDYHPTRFYNGLGKHRIDNEAGTNEGSCKIFSFAQMHNLDKNETLACFGHYYREHVLQNPTGTDHANIRNFIKFGWDGIVFEQQAPALR